MKNTEKTKRSGIIATLIALFLIGCTVSGVLYIADSSVNVELSDMLCLKYSDSRVCLNMFNSLISYASQYAKQDASGVSTNFDFYEYVTNSDGESYYSGLSYSLTEQGLEPIENQEHYPAYIIYESASEKLRMYLNGKEYQIPEDLQTTAASMLFSNSALKFLNSQYGNDCVVRAAYGEKQYSAYKSDFILTLVIMWAFPVVFLLGLALLIIGLCARGKKEAYMRISKTFTSGLFFELKWVVVFGTACLSVFFISSFSPYNNYAFLFPCAAVLLWALWVMIRLNLCDIANVGIGRYFSNNIFGWFFRLVGGGKKYNYFAKRLRRCFIWYVIGEIFFLFWLLGAIGMDSGFLVFLSLLLMVLYTVVFWASAFRILTDADRLTKKIVEISNTGTSDIVIPQNSTVAFADDALTKIENSCKTAAEKSLRDERTKIELITNVSHDLKTPLTSIISYTDLLSKTEKLQPEEARDYVAVLKAKTQRLKKLIEDLFELSKATTKDIELNIQTIDFTRLVKQALSYNADAIEASGLTFVCDITDEPAMISADGSRLHCVVDNLVGNALKYAMPGSRVYIKLVTDGVHALFQIKNVSAQQLNITAQELTERFVRGDDSRTTEGSGLGLAIASTYTELCGGKLKLTIDGDLFKAEVIFSTLPATGSTTQASEPSEPSQNGVETDAQASEEAESDITDAEDDNTDDTKDDVPDASPDDDNP